MKYYYYHNNTVLEDGDMYRATGYAGQYIYVIPKYDIVIVITGVVSNSPVDIGNYLVLNKILPVFDGYGEYVKFNDIEELEKYYYEFINDFDETKYIKSDYLF